MTTETPMRERIARAIKEISISRVSAGGEVSWEELADAVLDAMREPTKGMTDRLIDAGQARYFWGQMIAAAKEGK